MIKITTRLCILLFMFTICSSQSFSAADKKKPKQSQNTLQKKSMDGIEPGMIAVKFKDQVALSKGSSRTGLFSLDMLSNKYQVYAIDKALPFLEFSTKNKARELLKIYYFKYDSGENPYDVAKDFAENPFVEYAEPKFIDKPFDTPNDPQFSQQLHFNTIGAPSAWDIVKGETGDVVIAVVDGGVDWRHEDLEANIWTNEDEIPNNGVDDDNNGFVDDIRGWNFAKNSNDPSGRDAQPNLEEHGTHVAGIAAAVTNNDIGISGVSWNSKIMPINVAPQNSNNDSTLQSTYDGVAYAAENGADIINCSWGNNRHSNVAQEVVNFAYANGALLVCAAGNGRENVDEKPHYPSSYNHVLSVGRVDNTDRKAGSSNYGTTVDVFAPGSSILSTFPDNQYARISGTSMAAPVAGGVAALVKTQHPEFSVDQLRETLRVTAKNIDNLNPSFAGLMGKGRVDALKAVQETDSPAIRYVNASYIEPSGEGNIDVEEVIDLVVTFTNYLKDASDVDIMLKAVGVNVSILNGSTNIAALATNDSVEVTFQFAINTAISEGSVLKFLVDISSGTYTDHDFFEIVTNPPQILTHDTGTLKTSITAQGNIGFAGFEDETPGEGFIFNGVNMLFEGGLMIGTGINTVSDCIRGGTESNQDDDFRALTALSIVSPGEFSDQEGSVIMDDSFAAVPLQLNISQTTFTYNEAPFNDFIIYRYNIKNVGANTLSSMHVGLFFDWDVNENAADNARYDSDMRIGYVQDELMNPGLIAATKLLTPFGDFSYRSINNEEIYGGSDRDGFTNSEKWNALRNGIQTTVIDTTDVSTLISTGAITIEPDQSVEVGFAVIGAGSTSELFANAEAAQFLWDNGLKADVAQIPPTISTSVLQNPAASKYADIVVVADVTLLGQPEVEVTVGGDSTSVTMDPIPNSDNVYSGSFEFTTSDTYSIRTKATGLITGVDSVQVRSFAVTLAKPGEAKIVRSLDQQAQLKITQDDLTSPTYFIADYEVIDEEKIYHFGPVKTFDSNLEIEFNFDPHQYPVSEKLFIVKKQGEEWLPLQTSVNPSKNQIRVFTNQLGQFKLVYESDFTGSNVVPTVYALRQNYPNPFNPDTAIEYDLPEDSQVSIRIFNTLGQVIKVLYQGEQIAGKYKAIWDGTNENGNVVAAGIYMYQLSTKNFTRTRKMLLLK